MIPIAIQRFDAKRGELLSKFTKSFPESYEAIVRAVIEAITDDDHRFDPDPERIHRIDDGDYQGTQLFVIGRKGNQPSDYWFVKVGYGSCSGCDTLQAIAYGGSDDEQKAADILTEALHVVQGLRSMQESHSETKGGGG